MSKPTLLGKITKGKYKTSKELPPLNEEITAVLELLGTPTKADDPSLLNLAMAVPFIPGPVKKGMRTTIKTMKKWRDAPYSRQMDLEQLRDGSFSLEKSFKEGKNWIEDWYKTYRGKDIEKMKDQMNMQRGHAEFFDPKKHSSPAEANKGRIDLSKITFNRKASEGAAGSYMYGGGGGYYDYATSSYKEIPIINNVALSDIYDNYDILRHTAIAHNLTPKMFLKSIGVHEYGHGLTFGLDDALGEPVLRMIRGSLDEATYKFGAQVQPGAMYREFGGILTATDRKTHKYLKIPQEIYRRIDQLRYELGETPTNLASRFVKLRDMEAVSDPYTSLRRVLGHPQIENLYNKLPAIAPFGIAHGLYQGKNDKNRKY
tara:strand:- start:1216 stop:2334 length:1119 start_codon:yes stop_codon:yes gene_type:complete